MMFSVLKNIIIKNTKKNKLTGSNCGISYLNNLGFRLRLTLFSFAPLQPL